MIGADVKLYTPTHPLSPEARNGLSGPEAAKPITIGTDCWLCGGCTILPGMTIGNGSTVGAGAIVTHDVPDRVVVVGIRRGLFRGSRRMGRSSRYLMHEEQGIKRDTMHDKDVREI